MVALATGHVHVHIFCSRSSLPPHLLLSLVATDDHQLLIEGRDLIGFSAIYKKAVFFLATVASVLALGACSRWEQLAVGAGSTV